VNTESYDTQRAPVLDFEALEARVARVRSAYQSADPFPHIVLDDFLEEGVVASANEEFPTLDGGEWISYLHVNERKFGQTDASSWGPTLQAILQELNSDRFVRQLEQLTGIDGLFADPSLEGGGATGVRWGSRTVEHRHEAV